jgi:hypothetical protein
MTTGNLSLRRMVLPIRLGIDPMEGLLVANFEGDPEFEGLDPQVFDDPINGRGMRVLRYREDEKVDVYWQPGVHVDRSPFAVGKGIGDFMETTMEPVHLKITERGVDLHVAFTDAQGRKVELRVHEDSSGKQGFPLLAPVGADIDKPTQLFLVYMPDIDFVRRTGSQGYISRAAHTTYRARVTVLLSSLMSPSNGSHQVCPLAWRYLRTW